MAFLAIFSFSLPENDKKNETERFSVELINWSPSGSWEISKVVYWYVNLKTLMHNRSIRLFTNCSPFFHQFFSRKNTVHRILCLHFRVIWILIVYSKNRSTMILGELKVENIFFNEYNFFPVFIENQFDRHIVTQFF